MYKMAMKVRESMFICVCVQVCPCMCRGDTCVGVWGDERREEKWENEGRQERDAFRLFICEGFSISLSISLIVLLALAQPSGRKLLASFLFFALSFLSAFFLCVSCRFMHILCSCMCG
mmetsp:Transcript_25276/g.49398  ORF Transcript_25276/g.49398 Transcript_25276/m.49398 type:complete len:118 (+) Transcript_25276:961-1314(+)